jgi:peptide/nickel transport system permease protein
MDVVAASPYGTDPGDMPNVSGNVRALLRSLPKAPIAIIALVALAAVAAPILAMHDPIRANLSVRLLPPAFLQDGSIEYPLGTDRQGRDILARIIWGARTSMVVALITVMVAAAIGSSVGLLAGYFGGLAEQLLMRIVDMFLSFPTILIALVLSVTFGPSVSVVISVLVLFLWPQYARLVRGEVLALKGRDFVALAQVAGSSPLRIILVHLLPNVFNGIVVLGTLHLGWTIVLEGTLSFLSAGVPPPAPTWGGMVSEGREFIVSAWWVSLFPGLAILMTVLAFNLLGDWLRDRLDPKMRQL